MSSTSSRIVVAGSGHGRSAPTCAVVVEYVDDPAVPSAGVAVFRPDPDCVVTSAGLAAVVGQANSYLSAAKYTAIAATGATPQVHVTPTSLTYPCLPADAAAQMTALQALVTATNVQRTAASSATAAARN